MEELVEKPRIPETMIQRLANIARRLEALTDPEDGACGVPEAAKLAVEPYVRSWVVPDVHALLAWARGEQTNEEVVRKFPTSRPAPKRQNRRNP